MIDYLKSYFLLVPAIKKLEYGLTEFCYMKLGGAEALKNWLIEPNRQATSSNQIYIEDVLKSSINLFKKLPLKIQMEKALNIELFQDSCTTLEPYMDSACACRNTMHNHLLISYAEIVLSRMEKHQKAAFLEKVENSIFKSHFGININEDYELRIIHAWKLDNELVENNSTVKKKISKI